MPGLGLLAYLVLCGIFLIVTGLAERQLLIAVIAVGSVPTIWYTCFIRKAGGKRVPVDSFQPGAIMAGTFVLYVLLPAMNNWMGVGYVAHYYQGFSSESYVAVLSYCWIGLVSFGVGYRCPFVNQPLELPYQDRNAELSPLVRGWPLALLALATIGLGFKILHYFQVGGSLRILLEQLSPSAKRSAGVSISGFQIMGESLLVWSGLIFVYMRIRRLSESVSAVRMRSLIVIIIVIAGLAVEEYLFSGKRSSVIFLLLLPLVWWHYLIRQVQGIRALVYGALLVVSIAAFLLARILIPVFIAGDEEKRQAGIAILGDAGEFYINSGEFATFDMMVFGFEYDNLVVDEMGGRIAGAYTFNIEQVALTAIPRAVWKDKPAYSDLSHVISKLTTGFDEPIGRAITVFGAFYAFGMLPMVIVGLFMVGLVFRFVYLRLAPWNGSPTNLFLYPILLWLGFQYLRFGTVGFTWLHFLHSLAVGIILFLFFRRRNEPPRVSRRLYSLRG